MAITGLVLAGCTLGASDANRSALAGTTAARTDNPSDAASPRFVSPDPVPSATAASASTRATPHATATRRAATHLVCAKGYTWNGSRCLRTTYDPRPTGLQLTPYVAPTARARFASCIATSDGSEATETFDVYITGGTPWTVGLANLSQVAGSHWRWVSLVVPPRGSSVVGQVVRLADVPVVGSDLKGHYVRFPAVSGVCA